MLGNNEKYSFQETPEYYQQQLKNKTSTNSFKSKFSNEDDISSSKSADYQTHYSQYSQNSINSNVDYNISNKNFYKSESDTNLYGISVAQSSAKGHKPGQRTSYLFNTNPPPVPMPFSQSSDNSKRSSYFYGNTTPPPPVHMQLSQTSENSNYNYMLGRHSPLNITINNVNYFSSSESQQSQHTYFTSSSQSSILSSPHQNAIMPSYPRYTNNGYDEKPIFNETNYIESKAIRIERKIQSSKPSSYTSENNNIHRGLQGSYHEHRARGFSGSSNDSVIENPRSRGYSGSSMENPRDREYYSSSQNSNKDHHFFPSSYRSENSNFHHVMSSNRSAQFYMFSQESEESAATAFTSSATSTPSSEKYYEKMKINTANLEKINTNFSNIKSNNAFEDANLDDNNNENKNDVTIINENSEIDNNVNINNDNINNEINNDKNNDKNNEKNKNKNNDKNNDNENKNEDNNGDNKNDNKKDHKSVISIKTNSSRPFSSFINFESFGDLSLKQFTSPDLKSPRERSKSLCNVKSPTYSLMSPSEELKSPDSYEISKTDSKVIKCLDAVGYKFSSSLATFNDRPNVNNKIDDSDELTADTVTDGLNNSSEMSNSKIQSDMDITPREIITFDKEKLDDKKNGHDAIEAISFIKKINRSISNSLETPPYPLNVDNESNIEENHDSTPRYTEIKEKGIQQVMEKKEELLDKNNLKNLNGLDNGSNIQSSNVQVQKENNENNKLTPIQKHGFNIVGLSPVKEITEINESHPSTINVHDLPRISSTNSLHQEIVEHLRNVKKDKRRRNQSKVMKKMLLKITLK